MFIGESNGALYDTRSNTWSHDNCLRSNYCRHHREVNTLADVKATIRAGKYAWPGGYEIHAIMDEGGVMKIETLRQNWGKLFGLI